MEFSILIDLGLIVVAATLFGYIARLLKQPSLLAYIIAGFVVGPIALGAMDFSIAGVKLGISNMADIRVLSELGVAFLLFSVGVETDFRKMLGIGKLAAAGAALQVAATIAFVGIFSIAFPIISFEQSIFLGVMLAFSSTMVVVKILGDNYQINSLHGRLLIGFLLMQDLLVIIAIPMLKDISLALSPAFMGTVLAKTLLLILAAAIINRFLLPKLFTFSLNNQEEFYLAALSSCFIFIGIAIAMDLPIAVGAFIGGVALSTLPYNTDIFNKIRGLRDFFVIIFFASLGMQLTPSFAAVPIAFILLVIGTTFIIKPLMYYAITLFSGYGNRVSIMVALGVANISEFSLIIAQLGYNPLDPGKSILSQPLFSLATLTITISMVLAPYLMQAYPAASNFTESLAKHVPEGIRRKLRKKTLELEKIPAGLSKHVLILGGGTMGGGIAKEMHKYFPTLVIDQDSEVVYSLLKQNINAIYSNADDTEALEKASPKEAKLIVLAIPNIKSSLKVLRSIRKQSKETAVFARAHYYRDALKLYDAGANFVCMPQVIGSNVFLKNIRQFISSGKTGGLLSLKDEYMQYLNEKAKEEKESA